MISRCDLKQFAILTGSVAFGVARHNSDEDWLISDKNASAMGIMSYDLGDYTNGFRAYREGNLNLIVYCEEDNRGYWSFRERWLMAHQHCMIERPREKARRIKIFRHYLYGEAKP